MTPPPLSRDALLWLAFVGGLEPSSCEERTLIAAVPTWSRERQRAAGDEVNAMVRARLEEAER